MQFDIAFVISLDQGGFSPNPINVKLVFIKFPDIQMVSWLNKSPFWSDGLLETKIIALFSLSSLLKKTCWISISSDILYEGMVIILSEYSDHRLLRSISEVGERKL